MMDKMKLANFVHTNVQIVPLVDVKNVLKTELSQKTDAHVMPQPDNTKTETHSAQIVHTDVQLAQTATVVIPVLMHTEIFSMIVLVLQDIMMTELPNVNHVTTNV